MLIQGFVNATQAIRSYLRSEYAFSILYKNGKEVRVGHHKGEWMVGRFVGGEFIGSFSLYDNCDVAPEGEELIIRMTETIVEIVSASYKGEDTFRELPALVLERVFRIIGGKPEDIETINVVQPGRNARIDECTGDFFLSPEKSRFN